MFLGIIISLVSTNVHRNNVTCYFCTRIFLYAETETKKGTNKIIHGSERKERKNKVKGRKECVKVEKRIGENEHEKPHIHSVMQNNFPLLLFNSKCRRSKREERVAFNTVTSYKNLTPYDIALSTSDQCKMMKRKTVK